MKTWSMREVYEGLDEKRQTVQGWAKDILKKPIGNSGIALSFTEEEVEKLWRIKIFKKLGYSNKEVREELLKSKQLKSESLQKQIVELNEQKEKLERLIIIANTLKETGLAPHCYKFGMVGLENASFDTLVSLLSTIPNDWSEEEIDGISFLLDDKNQGIFEASWAAMNELRTRGVIPSDDNVQNHIADQFQVFAQANRPSVLLFSGLSLTFYPGSEVSLSMDEVFGDGFSKFYVDAVKHFCTEHSDNEFDLTPKVAEEIIRNLAKQKFTTGSPEVQAQIAVIHKYIASLGIKSRRLQLIALKNYSAGYTATKAEKTKDGRPKKDFAWFLSKAIDIYCQGFDQIEEGGTV